ncbi:MAG TPA: hypothetical protein VGH02_03255 [Rhizomicrobium sp.]|jgi:hypothetical protein
MLQPKEILNFAAGLIQSAGRKEIHARQAAARAYYSVMLLVRDELEIDPNRSAGGAHAVVKEALRSALQSGRTEPFLRTAYQYWSTLYDDRVTADYKIGEPFDLAKGDASVHRALEVFRKYEE